MKLKHYSCKSPPEIYQAAKAQAALDDKILYVWITDAIKEKLNRSTEKGTQNENENETKKQKVD